MLSEPEMRMVLEEMAMRALTRDRT
jgi:hypothetical protein